MAKLYISEFANISSVGTGLVQALPQPALLDQTPVDFTAGVAASAAFGSKTRAILICADSICSFVVGDTPVATTSNMRLPADTIIPFTVRPGQKISVIANT